MSVRATGRPAEIGSGWAHRVLLAEIESRLFGASSATPRIGRYLLRAPIGRGGCGEVFAARDPELRRDVAIKLVPARGPDDRGRLLAEGQAMARLSHEHIVPIYDVGTYDGPTPGEPGGVYLVLELFAGGAIDRIERASAATRRRWLLAAARGLAAAHRSGLVHCDFKPANVLLAADGRVAVTDFGLARARDGGGARGGTSAFMAPEQRAGAPVDPRADQFAFCRAAVLVLTGRLPPQGPVDPTALRGLPPGWAEAIARGLQPRPAARFADMDALLDVLAHRRPRMLPRGPLLVAAAAALFVVAPGDATPATTACLEDDARLVQRARTDAGAGDTASVRRVDAFVSGWSDARAATCDASVHDEAASDCLTRAAAVLHTRVERLAPTASSEDRRVALMGLPDPRRCLRPSALALDLASAQERAQPDAATALSQLALAHALALDADYEGAAALATWVLEQPGLQAPRIRLGAMRQLGAAAHQLDRIDEARAALEATFFEAEAVGDDAFAVEVAAEAAMELVHLYGTTLARHDIAMRWARHAAALLPDDAHGSHWYLQLGIAAAAFAAGDLEAAHTAAWRSIDLGRGRERQRSYALACAIERARQDSAAARSACGRAGEGTDGFPVTPPREHARLEQARERLAVAAHASTDVRDGPPR